MDTRSRILFLVLILTQGLHSVEEYVFRLYDVFGPARYLSRLISDDPGTGFILANATLILFGLWCYVARIHSGHPSAYGWAWFWGIIELGNGANHFAIAVWRGGYFPGVVTAFPLLLLSLLLGAHLLGFRLDRRTAV